MRGLFITFEGIEHCGKTTQSERLATYLEEAEHDVVLTREPGGTPVGAAIRDLVLHSEVDVDTVSELLLFAADRAQHVRTLIQPALEVGKIVISDRFYDSTRAYQGYGRGTDKDLIDRATSLATDGLAPDLTVLMDIDVETSRSRSNRRDDDRIEQNSNAFHDRVRNGFLRIAEEERSRVLTIDGSQAMEDVADLILERVNELLSARS